MCSIRVDLVVTDGSYRLKLGGTRSYSLPSEVETLTRRANVSFSTDTTMSNLPPRTIGNLIPGNCQEEMDTFTLGESVITRALYWRSLVLRLRFAKDVNST